MAKNAIFFDEEVVQIRPSAIAEMRRAVRQTASLVSGGNVREQISGKWAANFETRTIMWSPIQPDKDELVTDDQILYLIGHEASHLLYSGGYPWPDEVPENEKAIFHRFVNACEDLRIDRLTGTELPGYGRVRDDFYEEIIPRLHPPENVRGYSNVDMAWITFFRREYGQKIEKLPRKMKKWCENNWQAFSDAADLQSTAEVAKAILPLYLEIREDVPEQEQESSGGPSEGDLQEGSDSASGTGGGDADSAGKGRGNDDGDGEGGEGKSFPTFGEMSDKDDPDAAPAGGGGIGMGSGYKGPVKSDHDPLDDNRPGSATNKYEGNLLEQIAKDATLSAVAKKLKEAAVKSGHRETATTYLIDRMNGRVKIDDPVWDNSTAWQRAAELHGSQIRSLAHRLRSKLRHNAMDAYQGGHKRGRLDPRKAYRAFAGDSHIFRQRREIGVSEYTVGLLVDTSSSMAQFRVPNAKLIDVSVIAAEAIERAGIGLFMIPWSDNPHGVKKVNQPLHKVAGFMGTQINSNTGGTYESPALLLAENEFAKVRHGGKILITITDGDTEWVTESKEGLERLRRQNVITVGIGLGDFVPHHYPHHLQFLTVEEFVRALPNFLDGLIKRG